MAVVNAQTIMDILSKSFGRDGVIAGTEESVRAKLETLFESAAITSTPTPNHDENCGSKQSVHRNQDAPKRPASAYLLWLNDNRQSIANTHFPKNKDGEHCYPEGHDNAGEPLKGRSKTTEIIKKAGALWKEVTDEDKQPYIDQSTKNQETYHKMMEQYTSSNDSQTKKKTKSNKKFDSTQRPEAPDGWSGHHDMTYLSVNVKDPATGKTIKGFKNFDEAVSKANELGNACGGITLTSTGYRLRVGKNGLVKLGEYWPSGISSWVKNTHIKKSHDNDDSEYESASE